MFVFFNASEMPLVGHGTTRGLYSESMGSGMALAWGLGRGVMPLVLLVATANSVFKALSETVPPEMETAGG